MSVIPNDAKAYKQLPRKACPGLCARHPVCHFQIRNDRCLPRPEHVQARPCLHALLRSVLPLQRRVGGITRGSPALRPVNRTHAIRPLGQRLGRVAARQQDRGDAVCAGEPHVHQVLDAVAQPRGGHRQRDVRERGEHVVDLAPAHAAQERPHAVAQRGERQLHQRVLLKAVAAAPAAHQFGLDVVRRHRDRFSEHHREVLERNGERVREHHGGECGEVGGAGSGQAGVQIDAREVRGRVEGGALLLGHGVACRER